jgi:hypothetical protein
LVREIEDERVKLEALQSVGNELQETKERYAGLVDEHMRLQSDYARCPPPLPTSSLRNHP